MAVIIFIGKPLIQVLARSGAWKSGDGTATATLLAEDDLLHHDPYAWKFLADQRQTEIERLRTRALEAEAEVGRLRGMIAIIHERVRVK